MQKVAIALGAVATLVSASVFAADMAVKAPPPSPPAVSNWSGFYVSVPAAVSTGPISTSFRAYPASPM
jgi:hypothetical protein